MVSAKSGAPVIEIIEQIVVEWSATGNISHPWSELMRRSISARLYYAEHLLYLISKVSEEVLMILAKGVWRDVEVVMLISETGEEEVHREVAIGFTVGGEILI